MFLLGLHSTTPWQVSSSALFLRVHPSQWQLLLEARSFANRTCPRDLIQRIIFTTVLSMWWQNMLKAENDSWAHSSVAALFSPHSRSLFGIKNLHSSSPMCRPRPPDLWLSRTFLGWKLPPWLSFLRFTANVSGLEFFPVFRSLDFWKSLYAKGIVGLGLFTSASNTGEKQPPGQVSPRWRHRHELTCTVAQSLEPEIDSASGHPHTGSAFSRLSCPPVAYTFLFPRDSSKSQILQLEKSWAPFNTASYR